MAVLAATKPRAVRLGRGHKAGIGRREVLVYGGPRYQAR